MLTIPVLSDAPRAWAALPEAVRASVADHAARFEGHPDPAVAAVAVGRIRADAVRSWPRELVTAAAGSGCLGVSLAVYGQPNYDVIFLPYFVIVAAGVLILAASKWRVTRSIPHGSEAANLRVFLESPDAVAARDPGQVRRFWRRFAVLAAVYAVGIPGTAWLSDQAFGLDFELSAAQRPMLAVTVGMPLGLGLRFLLENLHRPKRWARRVAVTDDGVRFGRPWIGPWSDVVAWTDVLDVTLDGNTGLRPGDGGVTVWHLRDGTRVRVRLHGSRRPPEELILVARSHKVAVC